MTGVARSFTYTAFILMLLFGVVGGMFVAGYAFEDLSTWAAVGSTAAWLVPVLVLVVVALRARGRAPAVFVTLTVLVAGLTLLDSSVGIVGPAGRGPAAAIGVFGLGVAMAFLGLYRSLLAGLLLMVLGAAQLAATAIAFLGEWQAGGGPGTVHLLTTSSGVVVLPLLVCGALYLAAGGLTHESLRFWSPRPMPPAAH